MPSLARLLRDMPIFAELDDRVPDRLAFLPRTEFEPAFRTDPDVASAVVRSLGARLRHLVQLAETVAFCDVAARLAMLLAERESRSRGGSSNSSVAG